MPSTDEKIALQGQARGIAYHEAGHVVVGLLQGKNLLGVSLGLGDNQGSASVSWEWTIPKEGQLTPEQVRSEVLTLLAGREAHELFAPDSSTPDCWMRDDAEATLMIRRLGNADSKTQETLKQALREEVLTIIKTPKVRAAIDAVAARIFRGLELAAKELTGEALRDVASRHLDVKIDVR